MITIEHSHAEGTVVDGTARGDGTNHVIKATEDGWRFSRNIGEDGAWYLPRSRDRSPDRAKIDRLATALRDAGYQVGVRINDAPRPVAEVETQRDLDYTGRIQRYRQLAASHTSRGTAAMDAVDAARARIPLGQPVMGPRDANYRDKLRRRESTARDQLRTAAHWQRRAAAAETTWRYRYNPRVVIRRLQRLEAQQRDWQRRRDEVRSGGANGEYAPGGAYAHTAEDYLARADRAVNELAEQISYWRDQLAAQEADGTWAPWRPEHFRPGDEAMVIGSWYPVLRVNRKSLTVPPLILQGQRRYDARGKDSWTDTVPYDKVYGRRRDGNTLRTPPPSPEATCTEPAIAGSDPNPASGIDAGRCDGTLVARLSIHHDGAACGCGGTCLHDEDTGTDVEPWTDVRLLCHAHLAAYQATTTEALHQPPTRHLEHLR